MGREHRVEPVVLVLVDDDQARLDVALALDAREQAGERCDPIDRGDDEVERRNRVSGHRGESYRRSRPP